MDERSTLTWLQALKVYWAHLWRGTLLFVAIVLVFTFTYGLVSSFLRSAFPIAERLLRLTLILLALAYAYGWGMRAALRLRFSDFVVTTSSERPGTSASTEFSVSVWQGIRIWWAVVWRVMLISGPINLVSTYAMYGALVPVEVSVLDRIWGMLITWPVSVGGQHT